MADALAETLAVAQFWREESCCKLLNCNHLCICDSSCGFDFIFQQSGYWGSAWIVNASKSTEEKKAEINGKTWMLAVRASICSLSALIRHFMASADRRPASKYWHAFFRDSEGRLVVKSTRLKDRKQAQRVADTLEVAVQRKKSAQHVRAPSLKFSRIPTRKQCRSQRLAPMPINGSKPKSRKPPGHSPLLFHNDLCIFGFSRVEGRSRLKRSSEGPI